MKPASITTARLWQQQIAQPSFTHPQEVVQHLCAMQAQDFAGAKWSIGLRLKNGTEAQVAQSLEEKSIIRTWANRGTLHFVSARDAHWILNLLGPRNIAASAGRNRQLELDETVFKKCRKLIIAALGKEEQLTRSAIYAILEKAGIATQAQRGIHILWRLSFEKLICHGPHEDKQPAFMLFDRHVSSSDMDREEALAHFALRYFTSHGPATLADFAWWAGLSQTDARKGLEQVKEKLVVATVAEQVYYMSPDINTDKTPASVYLLPGFDEYLLGYKDRSAALHTDHSNKVVPGGNGMFMPTVVVNGAIAGTWKRSSNKKTLRFEADLFAPLTKIHTAAMHKAAKQYGQYLGTEILI
jgi:hypothetical protein